MRSSIALLLSSLLAAEAATVTFNWSIGWIRVAPDGFSRPVIAINGQWPPPTISVNLKDQIVIQLTNNLGNETTALHFHGQNQGKSSQMEGAAMVTQCPLPPGMTITYNFTAGNPGTHWYHAHIGGSYLDGFRGPLIVHDTTAPYQGKYDQEVIMTVSDWYHTEAPYLVNLYQTQPKGKAKGVEPVPDSTLINDSQNVKFSFVPGTRYLFRIINIGGFASNLITFDGHNMTIVEMDGVATVPTVTSTIKIATAQRYVVIVTALPTATKNYGILSAMDPGMFSGDTPPANYNGNATAYTVYDPALPLPAQPQVANYNAINEFTIQPFDQQAILGPVTQEFIANFNFHFIEGMSRGTMNGTTYIPQVVPTIYTALTSGNLSIDPRIYGVNSNTVVFNNPVGIAEIVVNNFDAGAHPFHIHGHLPQILAQGPTGTPTSQQVYNGVPTSLIPTRRDVFMVNPNSYTVIRFKTGNPGMWLLHCHIEWHIEAGLTMTFVEDPLQLQQQNLFIPQNMYDACTAQGIPITGNAGGDANNWYNLKNAPVHPPKNPWGTLINPPNGHKTRSWIRHFADMCKA